MSSIGVPLLLGLTAIVGLHAARRRWKCSSGLTVLGGLVALSWGAVLSQVLESLGAPEAQSQVAVAGVASTLGTLMLLAWFLPFQPLHAGTVEVQPPEPPLREGAPGGGEVPRPRAADSFKIHVEAARREWAEAALRRSEHQLAALIQQSPLAIIEWDRELRVIEWNAAAERLFGYARAEVLGKSARLLVPEAEAGRLDGVVSGIEAGDSAVLVQRDWNVTTDGRRILCDWHNASISDEHGAPVGIVSMVQDVTAQEEAERSRRENDERLRRAIEAMPVMLVAFDADHRLIVWNSECERVTGYSATEVLSDPDPLRRLVDCDAAREEVRGWFVAADRPVLRDRELTLTGRDGGHHTVAWSNVSAQSPIPGWASWAVGVDVTTRKQAEVARLQMESRLQEAARMESLEVLAGGVAHDFNNLLVGVLGSASQALSEAAPDSPLRPLLEQIEDSGQRAAALTRQMLAYSGRGQFVTRAVDLSALVDEMRDLLTTSLQRKAEIAFELAPSLPAVRADATQLQQIVMNLVINAGEAIGNGRGKVTVRTGMRTPREGAPHARLVGGVDTPPAGRFVCLCVSDDGPGMDQGTHARIFEPFFTTKATGRGLGLAAVLGIVRGHGGVIELDSELGKGTTFHVLMPVAHEAAEPRRPTGPLPSVISRRGHILVVDDDLAVRKVAERALKRHGYPVDLAEDGQEGLERFAAEPDRYAAVLLDMTMPRMSGPAAMVEILKVRPGAVVILMSGYTRDTVDEELHGATPAGFVQKPFRPKDLLIAVQNAISESIVTPVGDR